MVGVGFGFPATGDPARAEDLGGGAVAQLPEDRCQERASDNNSAFAHRARTRQHRERAPKTCGAGYHAGRKVR
jgi:hypothetical protein